jgi:hypothetical protein
MALGFITIMSAKLQSASLSPCSICSCPSGWWGSPTKIIGLEVWRFLYPLWCKWSSSWWSTSSTCTQVTEASGRSFLSGCCASAYCGTDTLYSSRLVLWWSTEFTCGPNVPPAGIPGSVFSSSSALVALSSSAQMPTCVESIADSKTTQISSFWQYTTANDANAVSHTTWPWGTSPVRARTWTVGSGL